MNESMLVYIGYVCSSSTWTLDLLYRASVRTYNKLTEQNINKIKKKGKMNWIQQRIEGLKQKQTKWKLQTRFER